MAQQFNNVWLCNDMMLNASYQHTYSFNSEAEQRAFYQGKVKHTINNVTPTRDNTIKVDYSMADLLDCSYLVYENTQYGNKKFYNFINGLTYVSENVTQITFEEDVIQTWYFNYTFKDCYIEREHVTNDAIGANTVPEGLEVGEYITTNLATHRVSASNIVILVTEVFEPFAQSFSPPTIKGGSAQSCYSAVLPFNDGSLQAIQVMIDKYAELGKNDAIISIFLQSSDYGSIDRDVKVTIEQAPARTLSAGAVNNKLYTYPYVCLNLATPQSSQLLRYEDMDTQDIYIVGGFGADSNLIAIPDYKGVGLNYQYSVNLNGFPLLPYNQNYYENWLAQNKAGIQAQQNEIALSVLTGLGSAAIGVATGGVGLAVAGGSAFNSLASAFNGVNKLNAQIEQAKIVPDKFNGSTNAISTLMAGNLAGFRFECKSIKPEYVKIIDDYFTMYGYKVNKKGIPAIRSRVNWNYIKMVDVNFNADFTAEIQTKIKAIYNNGITFWHNDDIANYNRSNSVR